MKKILIVLLSLLLPLLILFSITIVTFAEPVSGNLFLRIKPDPIDKGDEFRVVIEINNAPVSGLASFGPLEISYDPAMFSYVKTILLVNSTIGLSVTNNSQTGVVTMYWPEKQTLETLPVSSATYLVGVYFKANQTGTSTFNLISTEGFSDQDLNPININIGSSQLSLSVTIYAPDVKSDNNNLKSLEVNPGNLTPAFTSNITNYSLAVEMDVDNVIVSATPADSKAKVISVTGNNNLIYGENKINIVVQAENGNKKTYTITVTRAAPSPSPSPSPTPGVTINQPDGQYTIIDLPEGTPIPGGFYSTLDSVGGQSVPAYRAIKGDLTLYYLQNESGAAGFFYLDGTSGEYKPFLTLSLPAIAFPILSPDGLTSIPEGFDETTFDVNGSPVKAWQSSTLPAGQMLLYLMNNDGEKNFYIYDTASRLLSLYAGGTTPSETTEPTATETTTPTTSETGDTPAPSGFGGWALVAMLLGALCLILIGVIIWLVIRGKHEDDEPTAPPKQPKIRRVE